MRVSLRQLSRPTSTVESIIIGRKWIWNPYPKQREHYKTRQRQAILLFWSEKRNTVLQRTSPLKNRLRYRRLRSHRTTLFISTFDMQVESSLKWTSSLSPSLFHCSNEELVHVVEKQWPIRVSVCLRSSWNLCLYKIFISGLWLLPGICIVLRTWHTTTMTFGIWSVPVYKSKWSSRLKVCELGNLTRSILLRKIIVF